jgi:bifunctional non-homologous end joining protein LigD
MQLEGILSKRADAAYVPGNRGLWVKTKCLNREEFVVVGWTDPEGSHPHLGALLLAYYTPDSKLVYAGRAGTGMNAAELARVRRRLEPPCRSMCHHLAPAASAPLWCYRACIGCDPSWWPR